MKQRICIKGCFLLEIYSKTVKLKPLRLKIDIQKVNLSRKLIFTKVLHYGWYEFTNQQTRTYSNQLTEYAFHMRKYKLTHLYKICDKNVISSNLGVTIVKGYRAIYLRKKNVKKTQKYHFLFSISRFLSGFLRSGYSQKSI